MASKEVQVTSNGIGFWGILLLILITLFYLMLMVFLILLVDIAQSLSKINAQKI